MTEQETFDALRRVPFEQVLKDYPIKEFVTIIEPRKVIFNSIVDERWSIGIDSFPFKPTWTEEEFLAELKKRYGGEE